MSEACLTCKALTFGYGEPLSEPLDWEVKPGEFWAVAGPNGCGKTTLFKTLLGFLKPVDGRVVCTDSCAYVAQLSDELFAAPARVCDVVCIGLDRRQTWFKPFYRRGQRSALSEVLSSFELEDLKNRQVGEISPGERQRVLMAQALISRPKLVFLDEAASAMDPKHAVMAYQKMAEAVENTQASVIAITHHLDVLEDLATHILRFDQGKIVQSEVKKEKK